MDMKSLFELCYERKPDKPITKYEIRQIIESEDIFTYFDFSKRSDQTKFGNKINKFVGRVLSDIKMVVKDSSVRSSRQEYIFTKEKIDIDKSKIFGDFHKKDGNLGNLHNLLPIDKEKTEEEIEREEERKQADEEEQKRFADSFKLFPDVEE